MNNGFSMLSVLNGISKTLNIANQMIPLYKQIKPIVANSSRIFSNFKSLGSNMNINNGVKDKINGNSMESVKTSYNVNSPTFFQ